MTTLSEQKERYVEEQRLTQLEIQPALVTVDSEGFFHRSIVVRLPREYTADNLKEPKLWRAVQLSSKALRRFDKLLMVAFDESWLAEAWICDADHTQAVLTKPRLIDFNSRFDGTFEDDVYRIVWSGAGYFVQRKTDGQAMTSPVATVSLAARDLGSLYPRRA